MAAAPTHRGNKYLEAHARLLFGSNETSPIIWIGKTAPAIPWLVKSREMTGRSQTLPWWLGGRGVKTTENKNMLALLPTTCRTAPCWWPGQSDRRRWRAWWLPSPPPPPPQAQKLNKHTKTITRQVVVDKQKYGGHAVTKTKHPDKKINKNGEKCKFYNWSRLSSLLKGMRPEREISDCQPGVCSLNCAHLDWALFSYCLEISVFKSIACQISRFQENWENTSL